MGRKPGCPQYQSFMLLYHLHFPLLPVILPRENITGATPSPTKLEWLGCLFWIYHIPQSGGWV